MADEQPTDDLLHELQQRVAALYRLNEQLAAQCDRMRPVVALAELIADQGVSTARYNDLQSAVDEYRDAMAALTREAG